MERYDFNKIEKKWQQVWKSKQVYEPDIKKAKRPFYNLMMFPYPSAEGLHVGNVYAFVGSDIYGRFKRMQGYDVFEPIGLDGFGIHSENYALSIYAHPMTQAKKSQEKFYRQLEMIGNGFSWRGRLETYDPHYYRWTQWIVTKMFNHGLMYRKKAPVNWCPGCKTVLADEQAVGGVCERCGTIIERKKLKQWFFKITDYAEELLTGLDTIDWSERVKIAQRNWIGKSEGASIKFPILNSQFSIKKIEVFTTRPDTLYGATFMVISPELSQKWMDSGWSAPEEVKKYIAKALKSRGEEQEKTGVFSGLYARNPATKSEIPVWVADYVLGDVGTGAIMAVPAHDQRDFEFAQHHNIPIVEVIKPEDESKSPSLSKEGYEGEGVLISSGKFNGIPSQKARWAITKFVHGKKQTQYRLRDWLISRQRYWGVPIPLIFCEKCAERIENNEPGSKKGLNKGELENPGWSAVPEDELPVELPYVENFRPTGTEKAPLATVESFYKTTCPTCGGEARRETDVSDTFLDSSWYYFRYIDNENERQPFDKLRARKWLPVDVYIGGAEHAVLHLLYTRLITKVFHDWGLITFDEPFPKFRAHGLLIKDGAKMSKSRGNVINPDEYIEKFGTDTLRMYLMFLAPFEQGGDFRDAGILGITRFLERVWKLYDNIGTSDVQNIDAKKRTSDVQRLIHKTIKKVTEDIENLHYNTAISALMILLNEMEKADYGLRITDYEIFLKLIAPFAPHITEELWSRFFADKKSGIRDSLHESGHVPKNYSSIHLEKWPTYDPRLIKEEMFDLVLQVNGKVRDTVTVEKGVSEEEARAVALGSETVKSYIGEQPVKKTIFVKDRLINFVL